MLRMFATLIYCRTVNRDDTPNRDGHAESRLFDAEVRW